MTEENNKKPMSDKALNRLVIGSVLSILMCLVALCSTTFAWFTDTAEATSSTIQTAPNCLLETVVVVNAEDETPLSDIENGVTLAAGVTYRVTLTLPKDSASGYCQMFVGTEKYLSPYIARHTEDTPKTVTYYVKAEVDTEVKFVTHWGIYSAEASVLAGETLIFEQTP
ncbi:MAG: hypothetical protein IKC72_00845 [Clostridia bacterium]|nr:hypothetical protein [Clostridia bacterium]